MPPIVHLPAKTSLACLTILHVLSRRAAFGLLLASVPLGMAGRVAAQTPGRSSGSKPPSVAKTIERGVDFLRTRGQAEDGSYSKFSGIGVTALATTALLRSGRTAADPAVAKSLRLLEGYIQPDGGIYRPETLHRNYETCIAMVCFKEANAAGRYDGILRRAERFIKGIQWDEDEGKEKADFDYGGAGYGKHKRPDLSNTSFLVEALRTTGVGADDEAIQKALIFVSRCQNLESEHNQTPMATKNPDGGFYYTCAAGGQSQADSLPNGGLRSYASMTYAGLKSMIYAGLQPHDPRVMAAYEWIQKHYDLKSNPGLGDAGLYYYYHTLAKTLDILGTDTFEDAAAVRHDWRRELAEELASRQRPDGSWINANSRWLEGDPNLATTFALLSLSYCHPKTPETPGAATK